MPRQAHLLIRTLSFGALIMGAQTAGVVCGQVTPELQGRLQSIELPRANSGEKEIELVDRLYPESGNQESRRLALEQTLRYFPGDSATTFRVGVRLAALDWNAGRADRAHKRLAGLLAGDSAEIGAGVYSWAQIMDGRVLADVGRITEALQALDRVAQDKDLPQERRVEAATDAADIRAVKSPQAALDSLKQAVAKGGLTGAVTEAAISRLLIASGRDDELDQLISDASGDGPEGDATLVALLESARQWNSPGDATRLNTLANAVARARPAPAEALQKAVAECRISATTLAIQEKLATLIRTKPLSDWYHGIPSDQRTSIEDFENAIDQASRKSDPKRCLSLSLRSLAGHGADETFPRRIWAAAGYADWVERSQPGKIDARVCTLLLDLCDQFPPTNPYFTEGKFLRAERLAKMGDRVGQRAALSDIVAIPGLNTDYLSPACKLLGSSHESAGEYRQALEVYAQVESAASSHTAAAECVLHAVWINLSLGNNLEAGRLIRILYKAPLAVTRQMPGGVQLRELETLVRINRADECWNAGRTWWSEWAKFAVSLGAPTDLPEYAIPEIVDVPGLEDAIRHSAQAGDHSEYVRQLSILMSAARWQPSLCPEAAALCASAVKSSPGSPDDMRGFLIRMLASPHPSEIAGLRERKLCLAVNYLDVHQFAEVLRVAAEFGAFKAQDDNTGRAMHRVHALAALSVGKELPAAPRISKPTCPIQEREYRER